MSSEQMGKELHGTVRTEGLLSILWASFPGPSTLLPALLWEGESAQDRVF